MYTDLADGNLKILDLRTGITTLFTSEPGTETAPVWSTDGNTIYYRSDNGGVFGKAVNGLSPPSRLLDSPVNGPTQYLDHFTRGPLLFEMHASVTSTRNSYVASPDGSRFLVTAVLDTEDAPTIVNWMSGGK